MANYYATARTNHVQIEDMKGLRKSLEPFEIDISGGELHCLLALGECGWLMYNDEDIQFSFEEHVMPFVKEGECLITMEIGSEKLRSLTGEAAAYVRRGKEITSTYVNLNNIYRLAQEELGCENITQAEY